MVTEQDGAGCAWMFMKIVICIGLLMFALGIGFTVLMRIVFG